MDRILSLQNLGGNADGLDDEGASWFSIGCNNNSSASNCCTGGCGTDKPIEA